MSFDLAIPSGIGYIGSGHTGLFSRCLLVSGMNSLSELYDELQKHVINGSISLKDCRSVVKQYIGDDWKNHVKFSDEKYMRNRVCKCSNDVFEFIVICWNNNQSSPVHNHPKNGCVLKVLQGQLTEELYQKDPDLMDSPETSESSEKSTDKYQFIAMNTANEGDVSYMEKNEIVHKIVNGDRQTISLHIYSPPKYKCRAYKLRSKDKQ